MAFEFDLTKHPEDLQEMIFHRNELENKQSREGLTSSESERLQQLKTAMNVDIYAD